MDKTSTKAFTYESFINRAHLGEATIADGASATFMQDLLDLEAGQPVKNPLTYQVQLQTVKRHMSRAIVALPKAATKTELKEMVQRAGSSEDLLEVIREAYKVLDQDFN
jgi:hypothetical protein